MLKCFNQFKDKGSANDEAWSSDDEYDTTLRPKHDAYRDAWRKFRNVFNGGGVREGV